VLIHLAWLPRHWSAGLAVVTVQQVGGHRLRRDKSGYWRRGRRENESGTRRATELFAGMAVNAFVTLVRELTTRRR
jgi:hypothetical protein